MQSFIYHTKKDLDLHHIVTKTQLRFY